MPSADRFFCAIRSVSHPFVLAWQKNTTFLSCPAVCPFTGPQSSFHFSLSYLYNLNAQKVPCPRSFFADRESNRQFIEGWHPIFCAKKAGTASAPPGAAMPAFSFSEFITSLRGQTVSLPLPPLPCCQRQRGCRALRPCRGLPPSLSAPLRPRRTAPCGPPPASRR